MSTATKTSQQNPVVTQQPAKPEFGPGSSPRRLGFGDTCEPPRAKKQRRGFAAMDPAVQREIAGAGGRSAHQMGRAHEFDSDEAKAAGSKGGLRTSQDREHMVAIGRMGAAKRWANRKAAEVAK